MPIHGIFHIGNSFTFNSFHNNGSRHSLAGFSIINSFFYSIEVVAVNFNGIPLESSKLFGYRISRVNFINGTVNLKSVVVNKCGEIIKMVVTCKHSCFPNLTFFNFSVAENCVYSVILFVYFSAESHTNSARYTLTERTSAHINSRHLIHIGVSL